MSTKTPSRTIAPRRKSRVAKQHPLRKSTTPASPAKRTGGAVALRTRARSAITASAATSSKQSRLIALLESPAGGTLAQMMRLTGWQAHSVRGVVSGILRKKLGLNVVRDAAAADRGRVYRIAPAKLPA